jgi:hypothetical protein
MARAWIYDRNKKKDYQEAVKRAKAKGRQPPSRWLVQYYDRAGKIRSEVAPNKARAEVRRTELETALNAGTYVDPAASKVSVSSGCCWDVTRAQLTRHRSSSCASPTQRRRTPPHRAPGTTSSTSLGLSRGVQSILLSAVVILVWVDRGMGVVDPPTCSCWLLWVFRVVGVEGSGQVKAARIFSQPSAMA